MGFFLKEMCLKMTSMRVSQSLCISAHYSSERQHFSLKKWLKREIPKRPPSLDPMTPEGRFNAPVDYLPFSWTPRTPYNPYEQSGDKFKVDDVDFSLPKPEFLLSEKLKTTNEQVRDIFSLKTATLKEIRRTEEDVLVKKVQRHPMDFDSLEVKIAKLTAKVRFVFRLRARAEWPRRYNDRLFHVINARNKYLNVLYKANRECFDWLLKELNLEFTPPAMGLPQERYTKRWDLRRLTKEYCEKMKSDKLTAYHEELKSMQEAFLKEKEETLAWIAKEEKELGVSVDQQEN